MLIPLWVWQIIESKDQKIYDRNDYAKLEVQNTLKINNKK